MNDILKIERGILRWLGIVERINYKCLAKQIYKAGLERKKLSRMFETNLF